MMVFIYTMFGTVISVAEIAAADSEEGFEVTR